MCRCVMLARTSWRQHRQLTAVLTRAARLLIRRSWPNEVADSPGAELPNLDDPIANPHAVGLVNVADELVGASRAARYMDELLGSPI
jgi:hypothetical protein